MDIIFWIIPVLFAITIHEAAHGLMAYKLGDYTAKSLGRITLNPLPHIDPIGTILVPLVLYYTSGFVFGWAKPVPINYSLLRDKKWGVVKVSLAGPASNLAMAIMWALIAYLGLTLNSHWITVMGGVGVFFNLLLGIFNMLPIPPLDGSAVVRQYIPYNYKGYWDRMEMYGIFIVMALVLLGAIQLVILPMINFIINLFPMLPQLVAYALR
jgi:Zn-dependent protease